jgi:secretion/DNA translocation related TadE-like protein
VRAERARRRESGNASVAVLAGVAMVMVFLAALADLSVFVLARARAQTAADASALAAAGELIPGSGNDPVGQASKFARLNGASLVRCMCRGSDSSVEVEVAVPVHFLFLKTLEGSQVQRRAAADADLRRLRRGPGARSAAGAGQYESDLPPGR